MFTRLQWAYQKVRHIFVFMTRIVASFWLRLRLLLALLLTCEVICGLFLFQNVINFRPLLLALLLTCEVNCGLFFFQNVKEFRPLFLVLAWEVICELFFFQNVKNFRPHQRERQFYCATGRFFVRKPIIKRTIEVARWTKCLKVRRAFKQSGLFV